MRTVTYRAELNRVNAFIAERERVPVHMTSGQPLSMKEMVKKSVEIWARYTRSQAKLAKAEGIRSYFFLQPNQYVPGSKLLSETEKQAAYLGRRPPVEFGYAEFEMEISKLRRSGVHAHSLANLFRDVSETIYVDNCCHVNAKGNLLIAEAIGNAILD
jgi:hypothetical protein